MNIIQSIIALIKTSPLSDDDKVTLLNSLGENGLTSDFFEIFNEVVGDDFDDRLKTVENEIIKLKKEFHEIDDIFAQKLKSLENKTSEELGTVNNASVKESNVIWKKYYMELEKIQEDYMVELEALQAV